MIVSGRQHANLTVVLPSFTTSTLLSYEAIWINRVELWPLEYRVLGNFKLFSDMITLRRKAFASSIALALFLLMIQFNFRPFTADSFRSFTNASHYAENLFRNQPVSSMTTLRSAIRRLFAPSFHVYVSINKILGLKLSLNLPPPKHFWTLF